MHYAVVGAGNIGCLYGSNLALDGHEVTMIDVAKEHVEAINTHGLKMDGLHGEFTAQVRATTDPSSVSDADVALICVNGYSTSAAAATANLVLKNPGQGLLELDSRHHNLDCKSSSRSGRRRQ